MTEPTPNRAASEAVDLLQQEHELHKMARHAFEHEWERTAREARVRPDLVSYDGSPAYLAVELADFISVRNSQGDELEYWRHTEDGGYEEISQATAARAAGLDVATLEGADLPLRAAFHAAWDFWDEARSVRRAAEQAAARSVVEARAAGPAGAGPEPIDRVLAAVAQARLSTRRVIAEMSDERPEEASAMLRADRALTNAIETLRPDAEEDPGQEQQEWTVTPEQAQATWIETTTRLRTLIDTGQYTAARNEIREMDSYLHNYTSGGTPPDSVEDEYLYGDALNRTTVPLPSVASSMVLRDIRARGELVPDFPDAKHVAATTGVHGLHVSELQRALTQPGKSPTPRTHESVAFAGAWRAATKNLGEDLVVSYDLPNAPGQALVERLDGNLDSYVSVMRTGQREVILDDVIGNRIEPAELGQRLGLDEEGANTVMTGLVEALEAAENMRQTPSTTSTSSPTADPARQVPAGPVDPLTSGHLPPHSPTSTNSPSRF